MATLDDMLAQLSPVNSNRTASELFDANLQVVDELIVEIKKLNKSGKTSEAGKLIDIAQHILDNNRAYKELVERLMRQGGVS